MLIKHFLKSQNGNVAILFATSMMAICGLVGVSVDYARLINEKQKTQNVLDASVLAAATEYQKTGSKHKAKAVGLQYMTASLPQVDPEKLKLKIKNKFLSGTYVSEIDNTFLAVFAKPTSSWGVEARIKLGTKATTDFALAIDVSNTMVKHNLIDGLHSSLEEFSVQAFKDTQPGEVSVSVVPFANAVSFESNYDRWLDDSDGYNQTSSFNGCYEYQRIGTRDALSTVGNSNRIAAFDRRKAPNKENIPFCPEANSNVAFYIDTEADLTTKVSSLTTGQGTNTAEGLIWAWRTLSSNWQNVFDESTTYPRADSPNTNKVIILLTDGRPYALPSVKVAPEDKDLARSNALADFREVCDQIIAAKNIDLYTIVYGKIMNKDQRTAILNCTAGNGRSFVGGNEDQLTSIFTRIVSINSVLALSK